MGSDYIYCIKEKCEYCKEDDFHSSYYRCLLDNKAFKKDSNAICPINLIIHNKGVYLKKLQRLERFIEKNQGA